MVECRDLVEQTRPKQGIDALARTAAYDPAWNGLLDINWPNDISFGLNLQWPSVYNNPNIQVKPADTILLSFHTEQIDANFVHSICHQNPSSRIIVLYDGVIEKNPWWPKNVFFYRWITWAKQLQLVIDTWGRPADISTNKKYTISSLSHRLDLFRGYITATLLRHPNRENFLISWHNWRHLQTEQGDRSGWYNTGRERLDELMTWATGQERIPGDDWFDHRYNSPLQNSQWDHPAYRNSAINFTNESFINSFVNRDGHEFIWPGPYFTEKTWKPLIAGCAFVSVGQMHVYRRLSEIGFKFDYDLDLSHDDISNDLDRAEKILELVETLGNMDAGDIVNSTNESTQHNQHHIFSGAMDQACVKINQQTVDQLNRDLQQDIP